MFLVIKIDILDVIASLDNLRRRFDVNSFLTLDINHVFQCFWGLSKISNWLIPTLWAGRRLPGAFEAGAFEVGER